MRTLIASIMVLSTACGSYEDALNKQDVTESNEERTIQAKTEKYEVVENTEGYDGFYELQGYTLVWPSGYKETYRITDVCAYELTDAGDYYLMDVAFDCTVRYAGEDTYLLSEFQTQVKLANDTLYEDPEINKLNSDFRQVTSSAMLFTVLIEQKEGTYKVEQYYKKID